MSGPENEDENGNMQADLEAWEPQLPPDDFADRVMERIRVEKTEKAAPVRRLPWRGATAVTAALALAAAAVVGVNAPPAHGEAIAKDRIEVALGKRGTAVLEPGASVAWNGDDVTQSKGDVFYRVERGSRFRVHTPAGDVEVKGTCFTVKVSDMQKRDVRSGIIGGALTALAFVAVYEGKVAVSHASERADLVAGESAQLGPNGVARSGSLGEGEKAFDTSVAEAKGGADEPLLTANQRLAHQVGEYRSRLEAVAAEKSSLEDKLKKTEADLTASLDGDAPRSKSSFDLSPEDWKQLAREGTMKFRLPCTRPEGPWEPTPETMRTLGLAPQDAAALKTAYAHSAQRMWDFVKPLCVSVVGTPELAEKIGADMCMHLVLDNDKSSGKDTQTESAKAVAEMRAGLRPLPGPNDAVNPATRVYLNATDAVKGFEAELAQSLGPEEAHRLAYSDELCFSSSVFRSGPKKKGSDAATDAVDEAKKR